MSKVHSAKFNFCTMILKRKGSRMKKITLLVALCSLVCVLGGCAKSCEVEPIIEENHKLIVPPNFGQMPK